MLTDLRYAKEQIRRAWSATDDMARERAQDCLQRALDALERCVEAAEDAENRLERLEASGVDTGV